LGDDAARAPHYGLADEVVSIDTFTLERDE
jgi:hypothetical protein